MNADALLEGDYIKAVEFGDKLPANPTYTITRVDIERMPNIKKPGKEINKGVITFAEVDRGWVMNRTNVECLKALFGPDTDGWLKHRVTLGTEPTKTGLGIRIVGSPDIDREVTATWTPPRQRAVSKKMIPTGERRAPQGPTKEQFLGHVQEAVKSGRWTVDQVKARCKVPRDEVPASEYAAIIADLKGNPPAADPPNIDSAITAALSRGADGPALDAIFGNREPKDIPEGEVPAIVAKLAALTGGDA